MDKKTSFLLIVLALAASSLACQALSGGGVGIGRVRGSGAVIQEARPISSVKSVEVANQGDLFIEIGDEESLVIEAEDNLVESITSDVRNGRLILGTKPGVDLDNTKPIKYILTIRGLQGLTASSSGDIQAPSLEADRFSVRVSSSGDILIDELRADRLEVDISSSGNVQISSGEAVEQDVRISSSGNYDASGMDSLEADVRLSSSGEATIRVQDRLNATLSSSGDVYYIGAPDITVRETSSGAVIQK